MRIYGGMQHGPASRRQLGCVKAASSQGGLCFLSEHAERDENSEALCRVDRPPHAVVLSALGCRVGHHRGSSRHIVLFCLISPTLPSVIHAHLYYLQSSMPIYTTFSQPHQSAATHPSFAASKEFWFPPDQGRKSGLTATHPKPSLTHTIRWV
jgi:hypothetical protein